MQTSTTQRRFFIAAAAALPLVASLAGCYEKVVSANGPGADRVTVEPSSSDERVLGYPKTGYRGLPTTH